MMPKDKSIFYYSFFYHRLFDGKLKEVRREVA